ncbi:MAG: hypothetical protein M3Q97_10590, partial [Bacteroidota bacterium]|nr:hypothetical protein [Bacteroidota bacterium]
MQYTNNNLYDGNPSMYGDRIAWEYGDYEENRAILFSDSSGTYKLTTNETTDFRPLTGPKYVVWLRLSSPRSKSLLMCYDGDNVFPLDTVHSGSFPPFSSSNEKYIAWWNGPTDTWKIYNGSSTETLISPLLNTSIQTATLTESFIFYTLLDLNDSSQQVGREVIGVPGSFEVIKKFSKDTFVHHFSFNLYDRRILTSEDAILYALQFRRPDTVGMKILNLLIHNKDFWIIDSNHSLHPIYPRWPFVWGIEHADTPNLQLWYNGQSRLISSYPFTNVNAFPGSDT